MLLTRTFSFDPIMCVMCYIGPKTPSNPANGIIFSTFIFFCRGCIVGGFLAQLVQEKPIEGCVRAGSYAALAQLLLHLVLSFVHVRMAKLINTKLKLRLQVSYGCTF
ncbi:hypothetical protein SLE2022_102020 [Rubroshorea leprosula]